MDLSSSNFQHRWTANEKKKKNEKVMSTVSEEEIKR